MLALAYIYYFAECHYAECCYTECRGAYSKRSCFQLQFITEETKLKHSNTTAIYSVT